MEPMILIRDAHNRIGWLGNKADTPDQEWLDAQSIPMHKAANFYKAYPLGGGSVVVDKDRVEILGIFRHETAAWKPRHSVLVALWYALNDADETYSVPDGFADYYNPEGSGS